MIQIFKKRTQIKQEAVVMAVKDFIKEKDKEGKLTLRVKPKKDLLGKWWLHFSLMAGDTVMIDLPKLELSLGEDLYLEGFGIEVLEIQ